MRRQIQDIAGIWPGDNLEKISCWICGQWLYRLNAAINSRGKEVHHRCMDAEPLGREEIAKTWDPPVIPPERPGVRWFTPDVSTCDGPDLVY